MVFTIVIGLLFLVIVFVHYLQGFFSAAISAILAVISAVVAFSWHETIVESLLQGKAANVAHAMVLVVLFAAIYTLLRYIFDLAIPEGVTLPVIVDRVGGALMGCVAATFCTGTLAIAAQELPMGAAVAYYTKYDTESSPVRLQGMGASRAQEGTNDDELKASIAGSFKEEDRQPLFPIFPTGVDEMVVRTVEHLSSGGSMSGSQPLTAIHPDFLQELYGQRIGIQGGATHVSLNLPNQHEPAIQINGYYQIPYRNGQTQVRLVDSEFPGVRHGAVVTPLKTVKTFSMEIAKAGNTPITEPVTYAAAPNDKTVLLVLRITFGPSAGDKDNLARISPGAIRLVATVGDTPHNFYPIGTLEKGTPYPMLYADKPDDFIFVDTSTPTRSGIDAVFAVDKSGVVIDEPGKKLKFADNVFVEIKRMYREELAGKPIERWTPAPVTLDIESLHQPPPTSGQSKWHPDVKGDPAGDPVVPSDIPAVSLPPGVSADSVITGFEASVNVLKQQVAPLTSEQQSSTDSLKNDVIAKIRANPSDALTKEFQDDYLHRFREILTPAQQAKLDAFVKSQDALRSDAMTGLRFRTLWMALNDYSVKHGGLLPPDLGSLVGPSTAPEMFLQVNGPTKVPGAYASWDQKQKSAWVNSSTDFVYVAAGKNINTVAILAYTKHPAIRNSFLRADGGIQRLEDADAAKVIQELTAGKNPPPSFKIQF